MIIEIVSSLVAGGIAATAYFKQHGVGDDKTKIERIAANAGLVSKDGKQIRIYRRTKGDLQSMCSRFRLACHLPISSEKNMYLRMGSISNEALLTYPSQT